MSKFKEVAASAKQDDDAREILSAAFASAPLSQKSLPSNDPASLSKRAVRRVSMHFCPGQISIFLRIRCVDMRNRVQIAKFEKMKAKRQKHKAAKARSIAARTAKKLQTKAETEPETSEVASLADSPKNRVKLSRSSSRDAANNRPPVTKRRLLDVPGESKSKGRGRSSKVTGTRMNSKSKLVGMGKKRKEVIISINQKP